MPMTQKTLRSIDALHAQIAGILESEKASWDRAHPHANWIERHLSHTRIDGMRLPQSARDQMVWATASFPVNGRRIVREEVEKGKQE
jgi:hypothetical protein